MENESPVNHQYEELLSALKSSTLRGMLGRNKVKYHEKVKHLDILLFDIYGYWGNQRQLRPDEDTSPVKCYALYSPMNKEVVLYSFPNSNISFADNLTKERARFCEVIGNLAKDDDIRAELKQLLKA